MLFLYDKKMPLIFLVAQFQPRYESETSCKNFRIKVSFVQTSVKLFS